MKNRQLHRAIYQIKHHFLTLNNVVILVACLIVASWVWGSLGMMQRNYTLQRTLDRKNQELTLAQLETRNLELERQYYGTREYQELAVREKLGKGLPGEHVLILPKQPEKIPTTSDVTHTPAVQTGDQPGNFEQWMDFLFGKRR
jgi:Na+-transporting NADH:ubiquinone oxidoreductase subunit NqrC